MLIGSHGDGSVSETEVPIVTWGAGLSYAKKQSTSLPVNINQADVTPLMATLIGVPIPVHSIVCIKFKVKKYQSVLIYFIICLLGCCTIKFVQH